MLRNIAIVATLFHREKVEVMIKEAKTTAKEENLKVVKEIWVPGCYEVPLMLKHLLTTSNIDGAVVLGIIERGETKHGLVMGIVVHNAIVDLELKLNKPVGMAILGPEILPKQIPSRLKPYAKRSVLAIKEMFKI